MYKFDVYPLFLIFDYRQRKFRLITSGLVSRASIVKEIEASYEARKNVGKGEEPLFLDASKRKRIIMRNISES